MLIRKYRYTNQPIYLCSQFIPEPSLLESVTSYTAFSISLPLLATTWAALCLMRGGAATVSNSIHKHLMFSVFMAELLYLIALKARSSLVQNEVSVLRCFFRNRFLQLFL